VPDARLGEYGVGDVWTWTAIRGDCKLVPSWLVGERNEVDASAFVADLAGRSANRVQRITDGHKPYLEAVEAAFGGEIENAMLIKLYEPADSESQRRYSPAVCTGLEFRPTTGNPDPDHFATSYVERQNLKINVLAADHPQWPPEDAHELLSSAKP
jgi:hypothetical protein